jgi:hypothetical protein
MPIVDPEKRKEYDRKRYELRLLKAGVPPKYTKIDVELQKAREYALKQPEATRYGGRFAIGTPLIVKEEPDYTEDVSEADYDPDNYSTVKFRQFIDTTKEELDEIEQELETFTEDEKNEENVAKLADMIKTRIADAQFKYDGVRPIRRRIIMGIVNDLKRAGLLRRPDFKKLDKELKNYF